MPQSQRYKEIKVQPQVQSELEASLGYMKLRFIKRIVWALKIWIMSMPF